MKHPDTTPEARAEAEKCLAQFENFKVVYAQNTADEMNVVVPYFPDLECEIEKITEEQLEEIAGGELVIFVGSVGTFFAKLGIMLGVGSGIFGAYVSVAKVTSVVAGVVAVGLIAGNITGAVAAVGTGLGVGIAAAVGAFDGSDSVSVGHAS